MCEGRERKGPRQREAASRMSLCCFLLFLASFSGRLCSWNGLLAPPGLHPTGFTVSVEQNKDYFPQRFSTILGKLKSSIHFNLWLRLGMVGAEANWPGLDCATGPTEDTCLPSSPLLQPGRIKASRQSNSHFKILVIYNYCIISRI